MYILIYIYRNFLTTVRFVDQGIKEIEKVIRDFYFDDNRTTFLMTSDHGMTDWGIIFIKKLNYLVLSIMYLIYNKYICL